jgi:indole-3-glycerol phosphate synthase
LNDSATGTVLDRIVARTLTDLERRKSRMSVPELRDKMDLQPPPIDFEKSLTSDTVSLISEFKRASPSRGHFGIDVEPAAIATSYVAGGASAISCLTDGPFFEGSLEDLGIVAAVAYRADRPVGVLRKDFIVDAYQIDEARAYGASCILLIVAALDDASLLALSARTRELGMSILIEVHDEPELDRALRAGATMIGINNRNLRSLHVDMEVTERLAPLIPPGCMVVGESGISTRADVERLASAGVDAILVGESIITQPDREAAVRALTGVKRRSRDHD